jgi:TIR domain
VPLDQVFISYSHKDERWRDELEIQLKPYLRDGSITSWSDQQIAPGSEWFTEIQSALTNCKIAILLVSPDFLASDFIHQHELAPLLKEAEQGGVKILWVPVRQSAYKQTPLKNYQAVLSPDTPLAAMTRAKRDGAWVRISEEIEKAVKKPPLDVGQSHLAAQRASIMPSQPGPITFTVIPLGRAYIPETQHTVSSANIAQKAFKFEFRAQTVPIEEDKYTLPNGALDLCKAVGDLLRCNRVRPSTSEQQLILVTSLPDSDPDSARDYANLTLIEQCYFYHDSLSLDDSVPYAKNTAIVSTYIWDHLPTITEVSTTHAGRRALEPYLYLSFANIALSRCIDMPLPHHMETRGCPLDYCDDVHEIDRFFQGGRLCDECEHMLQIKQRDGEITANQLESVKRLLLKARGRDFEARRKTAKGRFSHPGKNPD